MKFPVGASKPKFDFNSQLVSVKCHLTAPSSPNERNTWFFYIYVSFHFLAAEMEMFHIRLARQLHVTCHRLPFVTFLISAFTKHIEMKTRFKSFLTNLCSE